VNHPAILLGTSSFKASGWNGSFYPRGTEPSDYLAFYAERFHTVEIDSTFYACPTARTLKTGMLESEDAIRAFAGDDISAAKYYDFDKSFLLEMEPTSSHYETYHW
jgi:hypothetical protein